MSQHKATISWQSDGGDFAQGKYSREHTWSFDGGAIVHASPSPAVVRPPYSNAAAVDPEEAFVASIASCHMLTFLYLASQRGYEVAAYDDDAIGEMTKNERGVPWVSRVVLTPRIRYQGDRVPTPPEARQLHADAHHGCFIANSVKTECGSRLDADTQITSMRTPGSPVRTPGSRACGQRDRCRGQRDRLHADRAMG